MGLDTTRKVNYQHPSKLKYHLQKTISLKIIWTCSNTSIPTKIRFISDILIGNLLHLALIQYRIISIRIMFVLLKTPMLEKLRLSDTTIWHGATYNFIFFYGYISKCTVFSWTYLCTILALLNFQSSLTTLWLAKIII